MENLSEFADCADLAVSSALTEDMSDHFYDHSSDHAVDLSDDHGWPWSLPVPQALVTIGVVIPFFQREHGYLANALASIAGQAGVSTVRFDIVVVDDASPVDPHVELAAFAPSDRFQLRIVAQANAGPAAARNRGLDALGACDLVAFLDSDDIWDPRHIARALRAFEREECDLFFCDSEHSPKETLFSLQRFRERVATPERLLVEGTPSYFHPNFGVDVVAGAYVSHTSTIVFRNRPPLARMRFDLAQGWIGEDHLMWATLASKSRLVAFDPRVGSKRGEGVGIFTRLDLGDPAVAFRRHACGVRKFRAFARRFTLGEWAKEQIDALRDEHGFELSRLVLRKGHRLLLDGPETRRLLRRNLGELARYIPRHLADGFRRRLIASRPASTRDRDTVLHS